MFTCVGALVLAYAASNVGLPRWVVLEILCVQRLIM